MEKAYIPNQTDWYAFWEEHACFVADPKSDKPPFSMVMPPPNVTGVLHMGHALVNVIQDTLSRFKRMSGFEVLWVPGTDHAGIATQTVVERHLIKTENKRRSDYSREEFLEHVWSWKEKSETTILSQLKKLGSSCDFSKLRFTMDEGCNKAVFAMFKKLFDEGLIYQGDYLVNWDPITQTALADDEVEHEEQMSSLWTFRYHLADESGYISIATTRPETLLGDTAVAVSPKDPRYKHLVGKEVRLPITGRLVPVIEDVYVDPEFGTGVVKITPAHDPNDYKIGLSHNLEMINVMTKDGRMNEHAGPYAGMTREAAREGVVADMKKLGLLEKVEHHKLRVGVSYRSKAVIEPLLSKQWFVKMSPFVEKLKSAVTEGRVKLHPKSWEHTYFHWIDNLRDWCISRQLWWGHRIPIWHKSGEMVCQLESPGEGWEQDPDVLDTWFSSALWPMSTFGWPDATDLFKKFYPTSVLVTGHDIIFFWVARMLMMGEHETGTLPFPETFLHGLIYGRSYWREGEGYITGEEKRAYDLGKKLPKGVLSKWEKLSKSKGNVIDPLEMIEEYGVDAVRMSLCSCANQSPQIDLDRRRFEEFRNFTNKIWNGARFVFMHLDEDLSFLEEGLVDLKLEDEWILSRMHAVNTRVTEALNQYQFEVAAKSAYEFFWNEFCAIYVEISKKDPNQKVLATVLCNAILLLHPMAPYITEELFQLMKKRVPSATYTNETLSALQSVACAVAPYPRGGPINVAVEEEFTKLQEVVHLIRNIRGEMKIPPHMATDVYLEGDVQHLEIIKAQVKINELYLNQKAPDTFVASGQSAHINVVIPLPKELEAKEKERQAKELEKVKSQLERVEQLLSNADFLEKAAPELIEKKKAELASLKSRLS